MKRWWPWLAYPLVFVPFGGLVVVLGSSALYYIWRSTHLETAKRLNLHAWVAAAIRVAAHYIWLRWHG